MAELYFYTFAPFFVDRDVMFRKMTDRNQADTNEMATTETKYQTKLHFAKNTNI